MEKEFFEKPTVYVKDVSINVTDIQKSVEFYIDIIGFQPLYQESRKAVLTADGKTPLLTLEQPDHVQPKEPRTTGLFHFAILLPTRSDLSAFLKHIIQKGVQLGASDHYVSEALYLNDPDGNGIEVYRDRPSSEWNWENGKVAMATEPLDGEGLLKESDKEWTGLPSETVMGHIHLHVADLQITEKFYVDGLGFDIVTTYPGALFASTGHYHHHLGLNIWNGEGAKAPAENSVGLNYFTLQFPDEEYRKHVRNQLQKIDATDKEEDGYYLVEDPSGNCIKLSV
ncbi:VOC family protein [Oceanobacillus halotolerans]|uniref:VOC family protein n=1 Tax=Oceanobacillus halotolerans TaxID=2663380 RepID=UPI0013DC80FE|nr:VOC family protein [Oceanobacillus halotolerans]